MWFTLYFLCLVTVVLCIEQPILKNVDGVKQSFNFRRAVDGRGVRNYFDHDEDGSYDSSNSAAGYYDSSQVKSGFTDIKSNVPGQPGVDYPVYEKVPKTKFSCEGRVHGYYADEDAGCQAFHVCHDVVVSSFICPVGAIFSQKLLTCDWWNKVECASTEDYYSSRQGTYKDTDEMVQKAYTMTVLPDRNNIKSELHIGERPYYNNNPTEQLGVPENFQLRRNEADLNDNTQSQKNIINVNLRPKDFEVNHQGQDSRLNNREDSPIVYIQKNVNYNPQDSYSTFQPSRLGNNFPNSYQQNDRIIRYEFQPSYAPTVPTVTTTTRRLYSPTVPTTYRPSTISYNNEDQYFDSSDHFYTHGRDVNFLTTRSSIDYHDARVDDGRLEHPNNLQRQIYRQSDHADKTTANKRQDQYNFSEIAQSEESIGIAQSYRGSLDQGKDDSAKEAKSQTVTNRQTAESTEQDTFLLNSGSNLETTRMQLETKPRSSNSNVAANERNYQHFYTNRLNLGMEQFARATEKSDSVSADNDIQAESTINARDGKSLNSINSRLGIPPLIVQIPRPSGSTGRPLTDIADQLFTFDSFANMTTPVSQTTESAESDINSTDVGTRIQSSNSSSSIPPLIPQTSLFGTSTGLTGDDETFDSSPRIPPLISDLPISSGSKDVDQPQVLGSTTGIPPLIPEISQSETSTGLTGDEETFDSLSRIPPLISDLPLSSGSTGLVDQSQTFGSTTEIPPLIPALSQSGTSTGLTGNGDTSDSPPRIPPLISELPQSFGSLDIADQPQTFESTSGIPPLIPSTSQSGTSTGLAGDEETSDSPSRIPPLISDLPLSSGSTNLDDQPQTFGSTTGIPPLIPEISQTGTSTGLTGDEETFDSSSRIPPLTSDLPLSSGSTDLDDQPQTFESSTGIPPLIPQTSQSGISTEPQRPGVIGDEETFDSRPGIPPLISEIPQSSGSTDISDQPQTFESSTRIPPLIPQTSQSGTSTGPQRPGVIEAEETFDSRPGIPPLISEIPQSSGSTDIADQPQTFESSTRIPPLIPPTSQSGTSTGPQRPSVIRDEETLSSPPGIPPLISDLPQSSGSTGVGDQPQTFATSTRIPPLIPQPSQSGTSTGPQRPGVIENEETFDSRPGIPPLISEIPQSSGSTDIADQPQTFESSTRIPPLIPQTSQSGTSTALRGPSALGDDETFDSSSRIPPLIFEVPQSPESTNVENPPQPSESTTEIPPLIPQTSQSGTSTGPQGPSNIGDDETFDSSSRIPPLIFEVPQSPESTDVENPPQTSESTTEIPPLIPQTPQSGTSTGPQRPGVTGDEKKFDSRPGIPPLIPEIPQSSGSTDISDQPQTFESSTRIPPLIPPTSQSGTSTEPQRPSVIGNDKTFDSPPGIPSLIPVIPQSFGSTNIADQPQTFESSTRIPPLIPVIPQFSGSADIADQPQTFESSTRIPLLIPQTSQSGTSTGPHGQSFPSIVSSEAHSMQPVEQKYNSYIPLKVPPFSSQISRPLGLPGTHSTNIFDQKQTSDSSDKTPLPFFGAPRPMHSFGTYFHNVFDSSKSFPTTARPSYFTFRGQYQRPLPFGLHQTPSWLPEHQFVTTPTAEIPAYDYDAESGSRLSTETATISPSRDFVDSTTKEFRIHVPEFPVTEEPWSTQSSILSTPKNPYWSGASPSKASIDESLSVVSINEKSYTVPSHITQTPVEASKVVQHSVTIDYQQSSVTDRPSMALTPLPPRNHSDFSIPTEQKVNEHTYTEVKGPTFTLPVPNENRSSYNSFNEASPAISSISDPQRPNFQYIGPGHSAERNDNQQFTIRGALSYPTTTPSPSFNRISPTYLPQSNDSPPGATGQGVFNAKDSNIDSGSYSENPFHKEYQESTTPSVFDRGTSVGTDFVQISSPSSYDNFGFSKGSFESSTLSNIVDTTSIRPAEKHDTSVNELLQGFGTSSLQSSLPSGFSRIEPSLNNNDSPYEIHFTVNANEDFNPSEDFISKILAQQANDSPLGLDGFAGYEIIKSESPGGPRDEDDVKSSVLPSIGPSIDPTVQRVFDPRGSFGHKLSNSQDGFINQNLNLSTQIKTSSETHSPKTELLNSDNLSRPFFFGKNEDVASQTGLKSTDTSIVNSPFWDSSVQHEAFQDNVNFSDLRADAKDINRSFESLFEFAPQTPESSPPTREQILKQLTENFGQPLYNSDSERYFTSPEASHNVAYNAGQQFANLEQYRVGKEHFPNQEAESTSPVPPKPSATPPEPVKTFVETEFIPSLSFSFDSDDGRKEYIDAVLRGLLTENRPVDSWTDDVNFYRPSRENLKPSNQTAKT